MDKDYMTGSELRRYLHISSRKLKYLMDHDYIPHEDTGQVTYKYRVRRTDARAFKKKMDADPVFLSELTGLFSSTASPGHRAPRKRIVIDSADFQNYLLVHWSKLPDALPTQQAAQLIGVNPQRLHEQIRAGALYGVKVHGKQYCVNLEIIAYASAPERLSHPCSKAYKALIEEYLRQRSTHRAR